jgi:hypothetical protein
VNETTYIRPPSQLRKASQIRRPQVIEHQPMPDAREGKDNPWQFDQLGIHIIPGMLDWPKFEVLWNTVDGIRQSSLFYVGDALNAGEAKFGERLWQIDVTGYRPETLRNAQNVARAFPVSRRRRLPFSYHQACASSKLAPREQDEILDMVEDKKRRHEPFTTKDLQALIQQHLAAKLRGNAPPAPSDDLENLPNDGDTVERAGELEPQADQEDEVVPPVSPEFAETQVAEFRNLMGEVRFIAADMANENYDPIEARRLSNRILSLLGRQAQGWASNVLQHTEIALTLVPDDWRLQIGGGYREGLIPTRHWEVKAHHRDGRRFVLTDGPSLPCCLTEAGLSAMVSELTKP